MVNMIRGFSFHSYLSRVGIREERWDLRELHSVRAATFLSPMRLQSFIFWVSPPPVQRQVLMYLKSSGNWQNTRRRTLFSWELETDDMSEYEQCVRRSITCVHTFSTSGQMLPTTCPQSVPWTREVTLMSDPPKTHEVSSRHVFYTNICFPMLTCNKRTQSQKERCCMHICCDVPWMKGWKGERMKVAQQALFNGPQMSQFSPLRTDMLKQLAE